MNNNFNFGGSTNVSYTPDDDLGQMLGEVNDIFKASLQEVLKESNNRDLTGKLSEEKLRRIIDLASTKFRDKYNNRVFSKQINNQKYYGYVSENTSQNNHLIWDRSVRPNVLRLAYGDSINSQFKLVNCTCEDVIKALDNAVNNYNRLYNNGSQKITKTIQQKPTANKKELNFFQKWLIGIIFWIAGLIICWQFYNYITKPIFVGIILLYILTVIWGFTETGKKYGGYIRSFLSAFIFVALFKVFTWLALLALAIFMLIAIFCSKN